MSRSGWGRFYRSHTRDTPGGHEWLHSKKSVGADQSFESTETDETSINSSEPRTSGESTTHAPSDS